MSRIIRIAFGASLVVMAPLTSNLAQASSPRTHWTGGAPLPVAKGGPVRVLLTGKVACQAPDIDACAMVKGLGRIRITSEREPDVGHVHH